MRSRTRSSFGRKLVRRYVGGLVGGLILAVLLLLVVVLPLIRTVDPFRQDLGRVLEFPSAEHPFGTDEFGRDVLSRVAAGGRVSLLTATLATALGVAFGIPLGLASGLFGGLTDSMIMRAMDVMLAFPSILLAILLVTVIGSGILNTALAIGLSTIPHFARLIRGSTLQVTTADYVGAARSIGCGNLRIAVTHVLPNISTPIVIQSTFTLARAILRAGSLGFLGLGVQPPTPEWGALIAAGRNNIQDGWHNVLFAGLALSLAVVGINMVGDAIRLAVEPRHR